MNRKIFGTLIVLAVMLVFCGMGLSAHSGMAQAAESTVKTDMPKPGTMPSGMQGMVHQGKMMPMCSMHQMMMGSMLTKTIVSTENGGVVVLAGDKLMMYDKDLNLVKEVKIDMDREDIQKKMSKMMEECPMRKGMMQGEGMMQDAGSMMKKSEGK